MRVNMLKTAFSSIVVIFNLSALFAGVEFDADTDTILVSGYPKQYPCTMRIIHRMDEMSGWGKISFDKASESWTVNCNLMIGDNNGTTTFFQIGTKDMPRETIVVNGCVRVKSIWLKDENADISWVEIKKIKSVNCLTIGDESLPDVKATLKINSGGGKGRNLVIGGYEGYSCKNYGGRLRVYNGTIESFADASLDAGRSGYEVFAGGTRGIVIKNARIADVRGVFAKKIASGIFENTIFDRAGFSSTSQKIMKGCLFENCDVGITCVSSRTLLLRDCVFKQNKIDWRLHYASRIVAIDCEYDKPPENNLYIATGKRTPSFVSKRHVIVKVVDKNGAPVANAVVTCLTDAKIAASEYDVFSAVTNKEGSTPDKAASGALLLTQTVVQCVADKKNHTSRKDIVYKIVVAFKNRETVKENFALKQNWETVLVKWH